jgi:hypothetical protein
MKSFLIFVRTKLPWKYILVLELIYALHVILVARNPSHDSGSLVTGLLLAMLTLPSGSIFLYSADYLEHALKFIGITINDRGFFPEFVVWQSLIFMNAMLIGWLYSLKAKQLPIKNDVNL